MSQTVASALDNRIVTFVNINDEYNCVICMQVADEPVRCSGMCAGIFCNGCMEQALTRSNSCPSCNREDIAAPKDVILRNQIMKHQVYCINKGSGSDTDKAARTNRKRKASPEEKCTWTGQYDEISTHMKQCNFEIVACGNEGCKEKTERYKLMEHLQVCLHRTKKCDHCSIVVKVVAMPRHLRQCPKVVVSCECGFECTRDALTAHRDKDCPLVEICCDVIGCDAKMKRGDYEKHQVQTAIHHVRLLSAALGKSIHEVRQENVRLSNEVGIVKQENTRQSHELDIVKQENTRLLATAANLEKLVKVVSTNPVQIKWRITDIAAKLREAAVDQKSYYSPRFDVFFHGSHKLYIVITFQGNELSLYIGKDVGLSDVKSPLDIGGTSITVTKAGLPDEKRTISQESFFIPPSCGFNLFRKPNWFSFLKPLTYYIDNDAINITVNLKLNEAMVL